MSASPSPLNTLTAMLLPGIRQGRAATAQAYMKTSQPFLGVPMPVLRTTTREFVRSLGALSALERLELATGIWVQATHREHWYAAQEICAATTCRGRIEFLPLYERMILGGAWWDIVDGCARSYGELLLAHPGIVGELMADWADDGFMWKRRQSMICQLHLADATDTTLLDTALRANLEDPEFFIRKALGWALRHYGRTDPAWVRTWVDGHRGRMSRLSLREALKHLGDTRR